LLAVAVVTAAGCTTTSGGLAKDAPVAAREAAVAERAKARWEALIKRDYKAAYAYFSPASRQSVPLPRYQAQVEAIEYRAISVDKVKCEAEACKVMLKVTYDFPRAKIQGVVTPLDEDWIIDQGQAWFVYRG